MISQALQFTSDVLDQFLRNRYTLDESKVVLNNLIEGNGSLPQINQNKIVMSLINIEKETAKPFYSRSHKVANGNYADIHPGERYNIDLLVSANFDDYNETLKFLDGALLFFQSHAALTAASYSTMPASLGRLEFEIEKITYHQMQSLWTAMGAKYQPSVIYKMRLVSVQANEVEGYTPAVTSTSTKAAL